MFIYKKLFVCFSAALTSEHLLEPDPRKQPEPAGLRHQQGAPTQQAEVSQHPRPHFNTQEFRTCQVVFKPGADFSKVSLLADIQLTATIHTHKIHSGQDCSLSCEPHLHL